MTKWFLRIILGLVFLLILTLIAFRLLSVTRESVDLKDARPDTGRVIQTSMSEIFITETGSITSTPILFIHGTAAWGGLWQDTADKIKQDSYYAIAMDLPPFGFSTRDPAADYDRKTQALRILSLIDALDVKPIIVAHSFGAAPAVEAAMIAPEKFSGLILVSGALGIDSHLSQNTELFPLLRPAFLRPYLVSATATNPLLTKQLLASLMHRKDQAKEPFLSILRQPSTIQSSTKALSDWLPYLLVPPKDALSTRVENYRQFSLPVALIWGDKDRVTPVAQMAQLVNSFPISQVFLMKDVGHIPYLEDPQEFQNHLRTALMRIRSGFQ